MASHSRTDHANTTRLAESECASIDMCSCGALQVHLGDLSLRLSPEVAHHAMRTLGAALSRRQEIPTERANAEFASGTWALADAQRGKA
jgi:hypothetical protein